MDVLYLYTDTLHYYHSLHLRNSTWHQTSRFIDIDVPLKVQWHFAKYFRESAATQKTICDFHHHSKIITITMRLSSTLSSTKMRDFKGVLCTLESFWFYNMDVDSCSEQP